jgi:hypothetical protein
MAEAATDWVSPYYYSSGYTSPRGEIHALNLNAEYAHVTAHFHDYQSGIDVFQFDNDIGPNQSLWFASNVSGNFRVRVKGDKPVYVWGYTPPAAWLQDQSVKMDFFVIEGLKVQIKLTPEVIAELT